MEKLILILSLFCASLTFGQSDPLMWAWGDTEGNLRDLNNKWFETSDDKTLSVLGGKTTLTQTGAQVQTILDGTFGSGLAVTGGDFSVGAGFKLVLDGGSTGHTYIEEVSSDKMEIWAGAILFITMDEVSDNNMTFNEDGTDMDIRFESNTKPDAFSLDGATGVIGYDSLLVHRERSWVADDGEITLATGVAGWGFAMVGDMQEYAHFVFTSAGAVTLLTDASGNAVNTDTDAKFCIYDAGTGIAIKNRLGSALTVMVDIKYADPTP